MGRIVAWWQWLLIGTGFFLLDMVLGPAVFRSGHRRFAILTLSLLASIISVCLVIGAIRCAKWFWYLEAINNQLADKVFLSCSAVVAVSTVGLPYVMGYGTVLDQLVVFGAWAIIARLSSGMFVEHHHGYLWAVAFLLNMIGFCVVAVPLWLLSRYRLLKWGLFLSICWTAFWVAMLFLLFPATNGP
jgi:hypothetical protein